jgi:hypothetical protein
MQESSLGIMSAQLNEYSQGIPYRMILYSYVALIWFVFELLVK